MTAFTIIGVLWFWMLCFEIGYRLGWLVDKSTPTLAALFGLAMWMLGIKSDTAALVAAVQAMHAEETAA